MKKQSSINLFQVIQEVARSVVRRFFSRLFSSHDSYGKCLSHVFFSHRFGKLKSLYFPVLITLSPFFSVYLCYLCLICSILKNFGYLHLSLYCSHQPCIFCIYFGCIHFKPYSGSFGFMPVQFVSAACV